MTIAAALIAVIILSVALISPRRDSVEYHEARLRYLNRPLATALYRDAPFELDAKGCPVHLADYFCYRTLRWYWRGAYTITSLIEENEKHQQALLQLGDYERREFTLTNRTIDMQLFAAITNSMPMQSTFMHLDGSKDKWFRVTARKVDMPIMERLVAAFDTSEKR